MQSLKVEETWLLEGGVERTTRRIFWLLLVTAPIAADPAASPTPFARAPTLDFELVFASKGKTRKTGVLVFARVLRLVWTRERWLFQAGLALGSRQLGKKGNALLKGIHTDGTAGKGLACKAENCEGGDCAGELNHFGVCLKVGRKLKAVGVALDGKLLKCS
jgi:hypothetical protein